MNEKAFFFRQKKISINVLMSVLRDRRVTLHSSRRTAVKTESQLLFFHENSSVALTPPSCGSSRKCYDKREYRRQIKKKKLSDSRKIERTEAPRRVNINKNIK